MSAPCRMGDGTPNVLPPLDEFVVTERDFRPQRISFVGWWDALPDPKPETAWDWQNCVVYINAPQPAGLDVYDPKWEVRFDPAHFG